MATYTRSHQQEIQSLREAHKSELDQLRLEMERSDNNHQQERDRLQAEVDGLRDSNESLRAEKEQVHLSWNISIHRVKGRTTSRLCVCCRCHCRLLRFLWRPHGCIHIYFLLWYYEQTFFNICLCVPPVPRAHSLVVFVLLERVRA
jgi:hypothetical protein